MTVHGMRMECIIFRGKLTQVTTIVKYFSKETSTRIKPQEARTNWRIRGENERGMKVNAGGNYLPLFLKKNKKI